ncbi:MAG: carboxymuconolactone decarboxylase family protein [Nitrospiraceae bacterium]|nr:carboxymuconolactone decarboxylase family protein [Nitrospiraceae bacterium]
MQGVEITNTRLASDLSGFHGIAQQMAKSGGCTADLSVDQQLAQLLRLSVAQLNPYSDCLILHTQAAHDQGVNPAKIAHLPSWRESPMFSEAEQAALTYCERLIDYDLQ